MDKEELLKNIKIIEGIIANLEQENQQLDGEVEKLMAKLGETTDDRLKKMDEIAGEMEKLADQTEAEDNQAQISQAKDDVASA